MTSNNNNNNVSEGEIWATRFNVGLARSQKVISSWLGQAATTTTKAEESDDEDFKAADERAPIGAKPKDDDLPESVRRSRMSNDKLLEQIIGKKAANAKRKAQAEAGRHVAPKPVAKPVLQKAESDEEEEEGRAAAFSSLRKRTNAQKSTPAVGEAEVDDGLDEDVEPPDLDGKPTTAEENSDGDSRSKKRKAGSYLDEVLAKKAKKSKKKKKKAATE